MNDDLTKKIKQITDILGQDNIAENLMGLMSVLSESNDKREGPNETNISSNTVNEEKVNDIKDPTADLLLKSKNIINSLNRNNDPRINLLSAISPFLNPKRQKHISSCITVLKLTKLNSIKNSFDKGDV